MLVMELRQERATAATGLPMRKPQDAQTPELQNTLWFPTMLGSAEHDKTQGFNPLKPKLA
jgi:hypothetical protein